ncbi:MAG: terpene cyclase/mutase family protein [Planctomycetaceae bacterium]|nr:terpene cyclase/mutase family protein [Planctomycetaceae bacterium]
MNPLRQLLTKLVDGSPLNGDDLIAFFLLTTLVASTCHLVTMLVTRWGDRHIAFKSLIASLLIHSVGFLSLEVFEPLATTVAIADVYKPPQQEFEVEILVQSDQEFLMGDSGNTAMADQFSSPDTPLLRSENPAPEIQEPDVPQKQPDDLESLSTSAEDISQFEKQDTPEMSLANDFGAEGPRKAAVEDPIADLDTSVEKNLADVATMQIERTRPQRGADVDLQLNPLAAMPQQSAPNFQFQSNPNDIAVAVSAIESPDSVPVPLAPDDISDTIEQKRAPTTQPQPIESDGQSVRVTDIRPGPARTFQSRVPRPSRAMPDRNPSPLAQRESPPIAQTPIPLTSNYDDVRIGLMAPEFSEAITSGAELVSTDLPTIRRRENPPMTYQLRNVEQRRNAARRFGGTQQSEAAVEASLRWMASHQSPDGHWDASDHGAGQVKIDEYGIDRDYAGREADSGLTALVTLSFLGAGYTHENGRYALVVDQSLDWLISHQADDGNLYGNASHFARNYCHAMGTYALAEAYGMQKQTLLGPIIDPSTISTPVQLTEMASNILCYQITGQAILTIPRIHAEMSITAESMAYSLRKVDDIRLRTALAKAVNFTLSQQDARSGGWRYKIGQEGDVSMFGWQMMSLKSAEIAGVTIDSRVRERMQKFLNSVRQGKSGGLFGYRRNIRQGDQDTEPVTPVMTAEALFCQQMLGYPRDTNSSRESVDLLLRNLPRLSEINYYYWYYGTLAMYQYGGTPWEDWNNAIRDLLISEQRSDGPNAGSWDPKDPWGRYGGRLYSTALATLTLEVYYRLLPLYRMNEATDSDPQP